MWTTRKFGNGLLVLLALSAVFTWSTTSAALSDKRLCADPKCQGIISMGTGKITYTAGEKGMVSFRMNTPIRIKSKEAGSNPSLWGIEVNGRNGYAPKELIQESRILIAKNKLTYEVDVMMPDVAPALKSSESAEVKLAADTETIKTEPLQQPAEGTTQSSIVTGTGNASEEAPQNPSPVESKVEVVDGTKIPIESELPTIGASHVDPAMPVEVTQSDTSTDDMPTMFVDDEEGEIGDYDDDDDDIKLENMLKDMEVVQEKLDIEASKKDEQGTAPVAQPLSASEKESIPTQVEQLPTNSSQVEAKDNTAKLTDKQLEDREEQTNNLVDEGIKPTLQNVGENVNAANTPTIIDEVHAKEDGKTVENEAAVVSAENIIDSTGNAAIDEKPSTEKAPENKNAELPTTENEPIFKEQIDISIASTENISTKLKIVELENKNENAHPNFEEVIENDIILPIGSMLTEDEDEDPSHAQEEQKDSINNTVLETIAAENSENNNLSNADSKDKTAENIEQNDIALDILEDVSTETKNTSNEEISSQSAVQVEQIDAFNKVPLINEIPIVVTESGFHYQPELSDLDVFETTTTAAPRLEEPAVTTISDLRQSEIPTVTTLPLFRQPTFEKHEHQHIYNHNNQQHDHLHVQPHDHTNNQQYDNVNNQQQHPVDQKHDHINENKINVQQHAADQQHDHLNHINNQQQYNNPLDQQHNHLHDQHQHNKYDNPNDYHREEQKLVDPLPSYPPAPAAPYELPAHVPHDPYNAAELQTQSKTIQLQVEINISAESEKNPAAGVGSVEPVVPTLAPPLDPIALPSQTSPPELDDSKQGQGLFATILGTVNSFISSNKKESTHMSVAEQDKLADEELQRILFPERVVAPVVRKDDVNDPDYCEKLSGNDCPKSIMHNQQQHSPSSKDCHCDWADITLDNFVEVAANKVIELSDLLACLSIVAASTLLFIFGYYCFCNSSREGALLSKLNLLERSLLASHKENAILKHDLMSTRSKLSSIEDNSFGSNDMVISLKRELEEEMLEKVKLQDQVNNLEKELENAAEAGLELNKIVSELLSNQSGDESIISSVEELQRQLNEQQNTIYEINANLADKSRENSELQLMLAEQNARLGGEIGSLQQDNDELEAEKSALQTRLQEIKSEFEEDITKALEGKNFEIKRQQSEIVELKNRLDAEHTKWQTSLAKIEALEDCLKTVKKDPSVNIKEVINVANIRAELLDMQRKGAALKERLDLESDARKLADVQLQIATDEVEKLKQDFHQSEKDKLEAQTRLEVLSNYFKEKENQLQKELSLKEAMWLKQQGETTSTVDRLTTMQDEIQSLKSQNDSLRAEIEAQLAAHKAQTGTLENRAHETWLAARQSERRCDEARAEATALRRKLTALAGGNPNEVNRNAVGDGKLNSELNNASSPIHMESPGSPLLNRMPPPPTFLPPPFLGPPPPFMGIPPPIPPPFVPPFVPPGEMRPAPLGRIMSPPPPHSGGPTHHAHRMSRYSPEHSYIDDYIDDYDDDDDDEHHEVSHRRRRSGGNWRDSYSPPPRAYRSHSPSDSRYNYTNRGDLMSTYDTETDFSPPPSPRDRRTGPARGARKAYSPQPTASSPINERNNSNSKKASSSSANKGVLSSGSEKSYNSSSHQGNNKGGKSMV